MKLSKWARDQGIHYVTAYRWFKNGKLPVNAYQTKTGTIIVEDKEDDMKNGLRSGRIQRHRQDAALSLFNDFARNFGDLLEPTFFPQLIKSDHSRFKSLSQEDKYLLVGEVPGFNEDEVKITVKDNVLTVSGKHNMSESGETYFSEETSTFQSSWTLPTDVNIDSVSAIHKNGVLEIHLPKQISSNKVKEIPVKTIRGDPKKD